MNSGKISNSVLKRSVLKNIKKRANVLVEKPAVGIDAGYIRISGLDKDQSHADMESTDLNSTGKNSTESVSTDQFGAILTSTSCGLNPVLSVANNIAACGGKITAIEDCIILPDGFDEHELKDILHELESQCDLLGIQIAGGHTQVSEAVTKPIVTVTGIGTTQNPSRISAANAVANQDIVMTKWIGISGIRKLIEVERAKVEERFRDDLITKAQGTVEDELIISEARIALKYGVTAMHDVSEGGIYAALWDLSEAGHVGLEVDFRAIPVKQEIIEVCELFDVNPYELESRGALLMVANRGADLVAHLQEAGIQACVIGKTVEGNNKTIVNQDETRFLDTPKKEEIYRFL